MVRFEGFSDSWLRQFCPYLRSLELGTGEKLSEKVAVAGAQEISSTSGVSAR